MRNCSAKEMNPYHFATLKDGILTINNQKQCPSYKLTTIDFGMSDYNINRSAATEHSSALPIPIHSDFVQVFVKW